MEQLRKDHHFVPRLYLKQWSVGGMISASPLLVPNDGVAQWKRRSLASIAYRQHLYTQMVGGVESDGFERWLDREFEAPAERPIMRAVTEMRLGPDDWRALVRFAVAQDVRTPRRLKEFMHRQADELPELLESTLNSVLQRPRLEEKSAPQGAVSGDGLPMKISVEPQEDGSGILKAEVVVGRSMWIWAMKQLLTTTIEKVSYKGWSILKAAEGCIWPTSDNPLIKLNYENEHSYDFEGGWVVRNGDILLPLSPTHLLHRCGGRRSLRKNTRLSSKTSDMIKKIIVEHADRYVFTSEEFDVGKYRRRRVDLSQYLRERDEWKRWHREQLASEFRHES